VPLVQNLTHKNVYTIRLGKAKVDFIFLSGAPVHGMVAEAAAQVVRFLWPFRKCRQHSFSAEFFFCDSPKQLPKPKEVLNENHVNTGYSVPCESLVVFRKQEWFKVFIHECFHYLGLDKRVAEDVRLDMFTIPITVSVREAYSETWARILQSHFIGGIEKERTHSLHNMVRVLRHMGLKYSDLWGDKAKSYAEETNVFAYIVLTAILLHDYETFIHSFERFEGNLGVLLQMIRAQYRAPSFLKRVAKAELEKSETGPFRMSANEIFF